MEKVESIEFRAPIRREWSGSSTVDELGTDECTMTFYESALTPGRGMIEWDIPGLEETHHIGVWFDAAKRELPDYDGLFSLPEQAIELLEKARIVVGEDFR